MSQNLATEYEALHLEVLEPIAMELRAYMLEVLQGVSRIDAISTRAKSPKSFVEKALKTDEAGERKYSSPLLQIQDQIGARINVLFLSDISEVREAVTAYFHDFERTEKKPVNDREFSYFGEHLILKIPDDAIPEGVEGRAPPCFELQIKTLFQHAWSETSHDIAYKAPRDLTSLENRKLALSAAQAWGADQIFKDLEADISSNGVQ